MSLITFVVLDNVRLVEWKRVMEMMLVAPVLRALTSWKLPPT